VSIMHDDRISNILLNNVAQQDFLEKKNQITTRVVPRFAHVFNSKEKNVTLCFVIIIPIVLVNYYNA